MKKKLIIFTLFLTYSHAFADIDLSKLSGSWAINCTQSQTTGKQGFVIETYTFTQTGSYQLTRQWYKDSNCKGKTEKEIELGVFKIGKENTNNGFNPSGTYETEYKNKNGIELGLLWADEAYIKLRVAKGFGKTQNTMLGLFEYKKI
jgi:hypothetical protein